MGEEKVVSLQEIQEEPEAFKSGRLILGTTAISNPPDVYKKQRVARIFVYSGICGCLGLLSYLAFAPNLTTPNVPVVQSVTEQKVNPHPLSFYGAEWEAMSFATHWLSGNREKAQAYAAKGFEIPEDAVKVEPGVKVTAVAPGNVKSIGHNKYEVMVKVYMQRKKEQYMVRLAVPMIIRDGSTGVYDFPNYVPKTDRPQVTTEDTDGESLEESVENEVRDVTESFFRLFAQGNSSDLGLLFTDGKKRSSIPGQFEGIKDFQAFKEGDRVKVKAAGLLNIGGVTTFQTYEIILSKDEGRWKIDKTRPSLPTEK